MTKEEARIPSQGYEQITCSICQHSERGGVSAGAIHINKTGHEPIKVQTLIGPATGFEKEWKEKHG